MCLYEPPMKRHDFHTFHVFSSFLFAGCKIKALRAKTNTYIKTPVRGEEPVFVVTGRKEDVGAAKREIMSAAEHFSQIRASRRSQTAPGTVPGAGGPPSPSAPGQVTIQVRVPYRVVGLVVGPKGATIKRIQQQTHTYIVTPSRDKEPVFEVTGSPENAEQARKEIESHIALRTGGGLVDQTTANNLNNPNTANEDALNQLNDFHSNGVDSSLHHADLSNDLYSSIYNKNKAAALSQTSSAFTAYNSNNLSSQHHQQQHNSSSIFTFTPSAPLSSNNSGSSLQSPLVPGCGKITDYTMNGFSTNGYGFYDNDDDALTSPAYGGDAPLSMGSVWSDVTGDQPINGVLPVFTTGTNLPMRSNSYGCSTTPRLSPVLTDSSSGSLINPQHTGLRRIGSDPMTSNINSMMGAQPAMSNGSGSPTLSSNSSSSSGSFGPAVSMVSLSESSSSSPTESAGSVPGLPALSAVIRPPPPRGRHCIVCGDGEIVAAFVPCGHNLFCMDCANRVMERPELERRCPVCQQSPSQAIRIFS